MSSLITRLPSRPGVRRAASAPSQSSGPLRRFPFVIAALIAIVLAAFVLFGGASRNHVAPSANPWADEPSATQRVPATPSRGAMGLGPTGAAPRQVSARTAP